MRTLLETTERIKKLMNLNEQEDDQLFKSFESGDFSELKSFLSNNSSILDKLKSLLGTSTIEDTYTKLTTSNKTTLLKGMADAKEQKDTFLYNLLDSFLKSSESLS
jgi:ATP phosphoribosyltransferase regulatory subunit HisZ